MKLKNLLEYQDIVIQCHDNPDADTVASAFGVYRYLRAHNKKPRIVYSSSLQITKSNLILMIKELEIPIEHVKELNNPELLVTVDCQYGEGNVTLFPARNIAIIDHHEYCGASSVMKEIRTFYASCATVVYVMLTNENFPINSDIKLATALYYGLYMDSNCFREMKHPLDMDLIEDLKVDEDLMERLKNTNFTLDELEIAGTALLRYIYDKTKRFAIVRSNPCDPNIMGLISDLVLQVDCIDCCVVYCEMDGNIKLSVRSCLRVAKANEIANYLTEGIGNGGGNHKKAGGFIKGKKFYQQYQSVGIENYLMNRFSDYFSSYDVIDTNKDELDVQYMQMYIKNSLPFGYVKTTDMEVEGTELIIRTLEGDVTVCASDDLYIMIGVGGEVYPVSEEILYQGYILEEEPFYIEMEYTPKAKNRYTGKSKDLLKYAKRCISTGQSIIYAKQLKKTTKVFSKWNYENYMLGKPNDYIACRYDDHQDIYIINQSVFHTRYRKIDTILV